LRRSLLPTVDVQHRQFLNYINDENTVQNTSGQTFQVDDGYNRYWMNTVDNAYAGGDINFGESQLVAMGLDPGTYEEVQMIKG